MNQLGFVFSLLLFLSCMMMISFGFKISSSSSSSKKKGFDIEDVPDPRTSPEKCGRELVPHSSICDPLNKLTKDEKDEIEGYINAMKDHQLAVVVIDKMSLSTTYQAKINYDSDIDRQAELFARSLHDKWGVGSSESQNGIVIFLSILDRVVYISTGQGVMNRLDSPVIQSLIHGMRPYLKKGQYGVALIHAIIEMDLLLSGKIKKSFGRSKSTTTSSTMSSVEDNSESYFGFFVVVVFVVVAFTIQYFHNRKLRNYEKGKAALDKLMKEVENVKENKFASTSCPICLEDFPTASSATTTTTTESTATIAEEKSSASKEEKEVELADLEKSEDLLSSTGSSSDDTPTANPVNPPPTVDPSVCTTSAAAAATTAAVLSESDHAKRPMALRCGHVFCHSCLTEYLSKPDGNKCPICRVEVDNELLGGRTNLNSANGNPAAGNQPNNGSPTQDNVRNRTRRNQTTRSFFPFRQSNQVRPLWNYHSSSSSYSSYGGTTSSFGTATATETMTLDPLAPSFVNHAPEIRYRLYRIHHMFPDAVTVEALRSMNSAIDRGAVDELRTHVLNRSTELQRLVTEIREASKQSARNSGMRGSSSSSWGGGSSRGGGGGRW